MGLEPTFNVCLKNKGKHFVFTDTTGVYDASSNKGGWGTPNINGIDIESAFFRITTPSGEIYDYQIKNQIPDNITSQIQYVPFQGDWEDGIYQFQFIIIAQESYTGCIKLLFTPHIDCCIDKILSKFVEDFACDACYEDVHEHVSLMYFRDALHLTALNKNEKQIVKSLEVLTNLCNCI